MNIYLITATEVKKNNVILRNTLEDLIGGTTILVQDMYLKEIIGKNLFTDVSTAIYKEKYDNIPMPDATRTLWVDYIKPYLKHAITAEFMVLNQSRTGNKGTHTYTDANSNPLSISDIEYYRNFHTKYSNSYKKMLIDYLSDNKLLPKGGDTDITTDVIGWFMNGKKYGCTTGNNSGSTSSGGGSTYNETDPIWESERDNYYTITEINNLIVGATGTVVYNNSNPTTISVGGISQGATFSNQSLQQMFDSLLYPYVAPGAGLSITPSVKQLGDSTSVTLNYSVTKGKNPITFISIVPPTGIPIVITPTGNSQAGSVGGVASQNVTSNFTLNVSDGVTNTTSVSSLKWSNRIYFGTVNGTHSIVTTGTGTFSSSDITELSSELNNPETYVQTRIMNGTNKRVVFMWPTRIAGSFNVNNDIKVGGFVNNDFTLTRNAVTFYNSNGYGESYNAYVFNNPINSSIVFEILS